MKIKVCNISFIVSPFFIMVFVFYIYSGYILQASYFFAMIIAHEFAHFIMFLYYKIKVESIELMPFGGKITYNRFIIKPVQEVSIFISGPICNLFTGLVLQFLGIDYYYIKANYFLFLLNILPLMPLDGGKIFRLFLSQHIGYLKANRIIYASTYTIIGIINIFILIFFREYRIIFSSIIFSLFIIWETYNENRTFVYTFMKEIIYKKEMIHKEKIMNIRQIVAIDSIPARAVLNYFLPNKYHLIFLLNNEAVLYEIIDEVQLIDAILNLGLNCTLKDIITHKRSETNER